jgi:hypothetical protein
MSWETVDTNKATEKQIKYAEALLEACYGDINFPIYTMSKDEISQLIDDTKKKCQDEDIEYHEPAERTQRTEPTFSIEPLRQTSNMIREFYRTGEIGNFQQVQSSSALLGLQRAEQEARRRFYAEPEAPILRARTREEQLNELIEQIKREGNITCTRDDLTMTLKIVIDWNRRRASGTILLRTFGYGNVSMTHLQDMKENLIRTIAEEELEERYRVEPNRRLDGLTTATYFDEEAFRRALERPLMPYPPATLEERGD